MLTPDRCDTRAAATAFGHVVRVRSKCWAHWSILESLKNERRKYRVAYRLMADRFEAEAREFNDRPREEREDALAIGMVLNSPSRLHPIKCHGCGGRGTRERRGSARETVPCRVCQGTGLIERRLDDERLLGMRPNRVYWQGRRWWRHWRH